MRKLNLILSIVLINFSSSYAENSRPIEVIESISFGPFLIDGDFSYLEELIEITKKQLEEKCNVVGMHRSKKEKIDYLIVRNTAVRNFEIRATDYCIN